MGMEFSDDVAERFRSPTMGERRELALLAEFMRHNSVASLAGEIAERLGANVRAKDLIDAAELGPSRRLMRRRLERSGVAVRDTTGN